MNNMRSNANIGHLICTSASRPAAPDTGSMIYETDTSRTLVWNGTAWTYTSTLVVTSATRPAAPPAGTTIYETDTTLTLVWNGSAWQQTRKSTDTVATSLLSGSVPAANMPTGSVIQVVQRTTSTNNAGYNAFLYTDCHCYITPQFTSSRIFVQVWASVWVNSGGDCGFGSGLYSNVGGQLVNTSRVQGYEPSTGAGFITPLTWLASPNTTSNHYYQFTIDCYRNNAGTTGQLNRSYQATDYSTMVLMEIR